MSRAYGQDDIPTCQKLVTSAFVLLSIAASVTLVLFLAAYPFVPWAKLMNADSADAIYLSALLVAAVFVPRILQLPFSIVQRAQLALQEGHLTNLWQCGASIACVAAVVFITKFRIGPVALVLSVAVIPLIAFAMNWLWFLYFGHPRLRPKFSNWNYVESKGLVQTGIAYCLLSVLTTANLSIDNLIVAHACGLEEVSVYSIASRVAGLLSTALGMFCLPLWAANGDAFARGDMNWVVQTTRRVVVITVSFVLLGGACLAVAGPFMFRMWLGEEVQVSRVFLFGLVGRELVLATASPYFMVLNGAGRVWAQIVIFGFYFVVSVACKTAVGLWIGSEAIPWAMAITYGGMVFPFAYMYARHLCSERLSD